MKSKFYLRKGSEKSTIQFEFRNGKNSRFRASTNFVINSDKDWDGNRQKMKLPSSTFNAKLINEIITGLGSTRGLRRLKIDSRTWQFLFFLVD